MADTYPVKFAKMECDKGSKEAAFNPKERGTSVGKQIVGIQTDTEPEIVIGDFGECSFPPAGQERKCIKRFSLWRDCSNVTYSMYQEALKNFNSAYSDAFKALNNFKGIKPVSPYANPAIASDFSSAESNYNSLMEQMPDFSSSSGQHFAKAELGRPVEEMKKAIEKFRNANSPQAQLRIPLILTRSFTICLPREGTITFKNDAQDLAFTEEEVRELLLEEMRENAKWAIKQHYGIKSPEEIANMTDDELAAYNTRLDYNTDTANNVINTLGINNETDAYKLLAWTTLLSSDRNSTLSTIKTNVEDGIYTSVGIPPGQAFNFTLTEFEVYEARVKNDVDTLPRVDPVQGAYTNGSGYLATGADYLGDDRVHSGVDYRTSGMTPPVAAYRGGYISTVVGTYTGSTYSLGIVTYGNEIRITANDDSVYIYAHLSTVNMTRNDVGSTYVLPGKIIGNVGTTGYSTGEHLHFERQVNGRHTDPYLE